ncbi:glycosyltransferase family 1 protein [Herbivorax sp. ANBcel31]|uniref:glycosyltransferase family 4 protein n=1 Tax=Herbivorax sp. ANBcel31 TaxID=3069754 RepID=UPI0027B606A9|nr:glycosyltransferase family 1 protein [Herbivorax sp. ANBcel31]MDQ2086748.1 glycosyltransferase family 1 protein [Herbivorax sp. ANBcel31]
MKIALFTDTYTPQINGVAKTLEKYTQYMKKQKLNYRVFAPGNDDNNYDDNIKRFLGIKFLLYPQLKVPLPNYFSIVKELNNFKPDIIHVATPFSIGLCGLKYSKSYNVPLVSSFHTNFHQYVNYFNMNFLYNIVWNYLLWFHNNCLINFCPSNSTMNLLKEKGFSNLKIWDRGIDKGIYNPKFRNNNYRNKLGVNDKTVFLYVGRLSPEKDIDILISTIKRLNINYMDKIHFLIVGDGPFYKSLKKNEFPNVTLTGFKKGKELSTIYASSDIFLFPSSSETFGNVILEAMASGLPVIACKNAGVIDKNLIKSSLITCKPRNGNDFFNASELLLNHKEYRDFLISKGLNYISSKSWDNVFSSLIDNYSTILDHDALNICKKAV